MYSYWLDTLCGDVILQYGLIWKFSLFLMLARLLNLQGVLDGKYDDLSEQSFYMVGGIEEVIAKAEKIAKESAA